MALYPVPVFRPGRVLWQACRRRFRHRECRNDWFARAAAHTIVACESIVEGSYFNDPEKARQVFWERAVTQSVVVTPGGAHPSSNDPSYGFDVAHFGVYAKHVAEGTFDAYRTQVIGDSEADYIDAVGGIDAIHALSLPVY